MKQPRIAFIGAGNMAASLIGGLRAQGLAASQLCASEPGAEQRAKVAGEHGIEVFAGNAEAVQGADVIVLAVKPQVMKAVCLEVAPSLSEGQFSGFELEFAGALESAERGVARRIAIDHDLIVRRQADIHRMQHRAEHRDGEHALQVTVAVPIHHRHRVTGLHTRCRQDIRQTRYPLVESGIAVAQQIAIDDFTSLLVAAAGKQ